MNFKLLSLVLGVTALEFNTPLMGGKKTTKLDEGQAKKIEEALALTDKYKSENEELKALAEKMKASQEEIQQALTDALKSNNLDAQENMAASIEALGAQCKKYAESKNSHSFAPVQGSDDDPREDDEPKLEGGYMDPNDDIYQTLKNL
ncbi:hypothetical protein [Ornithobacterium rhinotracheale]|uniref:hypothetical protein n=1 Tax=Ornithobacterium rhinotracheale TaxID=28251 RepID=UPI001FF3BC1E|nr:hypothetical protein [Ornithobacterium rhinotracheale]MCK0201330.1 hypothetical protein [Ornithobacterium rhinotracheale]